MRALLLGGYLALAAALLLLPGAADPPPELRLPDATQRSFALSGSTLTITPGAEITRLSFADGVSVSGSGSLSARSVEVEIKSTLALGGGLKLPQGDVSSARVSGQPGQAISEMAKELKLPRANLSASAIHSVVASGGVTIRTAELVLTTAELSSSDGGRSWAANNRTQISRPAGSGDSYQLAADTLLYDTQGERAAARGNIVGHFERTGQATLQFSAQSCDYDIKAQRISANGELAVSYGAATLHSAGITADLATSKLSATGGVQLSDSEQGLSLSADGVEASLDSEQFTAQGQVRLIYDRLQIKLSCEQVQVDLAQERIVAEGQPLLTYLDSSYSGSRIILHREGEKTVVEVEGPQEAQINLDNLEPPPAAE